MEEKEQIIAIPAVKNYSKISTSQPKVCPKEASLVSVEGDIMLLAFCLLMVHEINSCEHLLSSLI